MLRTNHFSEAILTRRVKALAVGLLVVLAVVAFVLLEATPAHADTTFVVNSTADGGDNNTADNSCFTGNTRIILVGNVLVRENECTLRAAIQQANATTGADMINFNIRTNDSGYNSTTGVWTITPASALPRITDPVTIDGYTQPGASPNTNGLGEADNAVRKIVLDGGDSIPVALEISSSTVKGLAMNHFAGFTIKCFSDSVIEGNFIGTNPSGSTGVWVNGFNNTIGGTATGAGNVISSNQGDGVFVASGRGNSVLSNSISSNGERGIDLDSGGSFDNPDDVTPNDQGDFDSGANWLQNFPVLTSAVVSNSTTITGTMNSWPDTAYNVQFFSSPEADSSGNGEGQTYLGQTNVTTNASGNASFTFTPSNVPAGKQVVTATATSPGGDTSEFSAAIPIRPVNDNFANAQAISGNTSSVNGTTVNATRETGEPDHISTNASFGEHSVWYRWTAPVSGSASIDTCTTNTDSVLAVYTGNSFGNLSRVADNNDGCASGSGSKVTFGVTAGTTYRIAVAGFDSSSEGAFTLKLVLTDNVAPRVTGVTPRNLATGVSPTANVTATFSEAMNAATINRTTFKLVRKGTTRAVSATVSYSASTRKATLNPSNSLVRGATYVATVKGGATGVKDLAGNALAANKVWKFTVKR